MAAALPAHPYVLSFRGHVTIICSGALFAFEPEPNPKSKI
jgi:hypothetical protein